MMDRRSFLLGGAAALVPSLVKAQTVTTPPTINGATPALAAKYARLKRIAAAAKNSNPIDNPVYFGCTVTVQNSPSSALTQRVIPVTTGGVTAQFNQFNYNGGSPANWSGTSMLMFPSSSISPSTTGNVGFNYAATPAGYIGGNTTTLQAWTWEAEFISDAPTLEILFFSAANQNVRLIIDGQYATSSAIPLNNYSSAVQVLHVDFGGVRKFRHFRFRGHNGTGFEGVYIGSQDRISPPDTADIITVEGYGTSVTEGAGNPNPQDPDAGYFNQLGHLLGWRNMVCRGSGSCGYLANNGGLRSTARQQVGYWNTQPDIFWVDPAYNDVETQTPSAIAAEALLCWQAMRARAPNALIIVCGVYGGVRGPDTATINGEAALYTQWLAWGDANSIWIPISTNTQPWIFGTGYTGATNGSGNSDFYMYSDAIHPTTAGHAFIARQYAVAMRGLLQGF